MKIEATTRLKVTAADDVDFNSGMKKLGFKVNENDSGSRGDYYIISYIPIAALKRNGWAGNIDVHSSRFGSTRQYSAEGILRSGRAVIKINVKKTPDASAVLKAIAAAMESKV